MGKSDDDDVRRYGTGRRSIWVQDRGNNAAVFKFRDPYAGGVWLKDKAVLGVWGFGGFEVCEQWGKRPFLLSVE